MFSFASLFSLDEIGALCVSGGDAGVELQSRPSIVGQQADGTLIVTWQQQQTHSTAAVVTCLGFYSAHKLVQCAFRLDGPQTIVSCSANADLSLLAYCTSSSAGSDGTTVYETFLAEARPHGQAMSLKVVTAELQTVQFVVTGKGSQHLLYAVANLYVHLYQIYARALKPGDARISSPPALRQAIVRQPLWYSWDTRHAMLSYIVAAPQRPALTSSVGVSAGSPAPRSSKREPTGPCVLHIVCYSDRNRNASFPLDLDFDEQQELAVVHMADHGLCLSARSASTRPRSRRGSSQRSSCCTTACASRCRCRCRRRRAARRRRASALWSPALSIGVASQLRFNPQSPYALAAAIGDCLSVYAPGVALRMFDCGREHEPTAGLMLDDAKFVPTLPCGGTPLPFDVLLGAPAPPSRARAASCATCGVCYEYSFEAHTLLALCDEARGDVHRQALHFVLQHLRNRELVDDIVSHICESRPHWVTRGLMSEYLVSAAYEHARAAGVAAPFLDVLPVTMLPTLTPEYVRANQRSLCELECAALSGYTFDTTSNKKWYLEQRRFQLESLHPDNAQRDVPAPTARSDSNGGGGVVEAVPESPVRAAATWNPRTDPTGETLGGGDASGGASGAGGGSTWNASMMSATMPAMLAFSPPRALPRGQSARTVRSQTSGRTQLLRHGSQFSPLTSSALVDSPPALRARDNDAAPAPADDEDYASLSSSSSGNTAASLTASSATVASASGADGRDSPMPASVQASPAQASPTQSQSTAATTTTMRRFFFGLFGIEQLTSPKRAVEEVDDSPPTVDVVPRAQIVQQLGQHLSAALGRQASKDKCMATARTYVSCCVAASAALTAAVHRGNERNGESEYLRQLECVYLALERLALPCTVDLRYDMSDLGWRCLPFPMFMQYVERGIFLLNDELIAELLASLDAGAGSRPDADAARMRAYLLTRMSDRARCATYMRTHMPPSVPLLEFHLQSVALNATTLVASLEQRDMECGTASFFLPLSLCLDAIALAAPDTRASRPSRQWAARGSVDTTVDALTFVSTGAQQFYRGYFEADAVDISEDPA
jgi:hypothetical protein